MKTVWKFPFEVDDTIEIEMPRGARILHINVQTQRLPEFAGGGVLREAPCMWALVDPDEPKVKRSFILAGTGHTLPDFPMKHLGTFKMAQDRLVFHVFEKA